MFSAKKPIKRAIQTVFRLAERTREPTLVNRHRILGLETVHGIESTAVLQVSGPRDAQGSHLRLGAGVWIGQRVEIEAVAPGCIEIGENTSLQHDCIVRGDVTIGSNCIFARACMVMSTTHHFRDRPEWLISDQDIAFLKAPEQTADTAVTIGEDCWFGACCAIMPGVVIGRGAIIGANSVVTRNIRPYEIHAGAPNRCIGTRLSFSPPRRISAMDDRHLPYFYEGFQLKQAQLSWSRQLLVVAAGSRCRLVLEHSANSVMITGRLIQDAPLIVKTRRNGGNWQRHRLEDKDFRVTIAADGESPASPAEQLGEFTVLDIQTDDMGKASAYGIAEVEIV
jgi:acetyltransferase-like isoleucine patch superfamily enzyme